MKTWVKVKRDKIDIEKGYNLCPTCKSELEELISTKDEDGNDCINAHQERCIKGCYVFDFNLGKRIK